MPSPVCQALWMGVPVVTMTGDRHAGRVGASILHHAGLDKTMVADNAKAYVQLAVGLARDSEKLVDLRKSLRNQLMVSPLCDAKTFTNTLEETYLRVWERYVFSNTQ